MRLFLQFRRKMRVLSKIYLIYSHDKTVGDEKR